MHALSYKKKLIKKQSNVPFAGELRISRERNEKIDPQKKEKYPPL